MRRILVAVAVLLALLASAHVIRLRRAREARRERARSRLVQVDERALRAVVLVAGGTEWRFVSEGSGWRLVEPVEDAADVLAMQEVLGALTRARVSRVVEHPATLAEYGLDPPEVRLRLEGSASATVDLGRLAPTGTGLFARVAGRPGVLVLDVTTAAPLVRLTPDHLRDSSLSGVPRAAVTEVTVRDGRNRIRLALEEGDWWIVEPRRLPASVAAVGRLFGALEAASVQRYVDGADASDSRFGLGESALRITLKAGPVRRRVLVGAQAPPDGRYAARDDRGTVLVVQAAPLRTLPRSLDDLATRRLTLVNRYQVVHFSYASRGARVEASSDAAGGWADATGRKLNGDDVYTFLARILTARVKGFREMSSAPGAPSAVLEWDKKDGGSGKVVFYPGGLAAVSTVPGTAFRVSSPPPPVPAFR